IIRNNKKINMVVRSVGRIPNTFVAEATYKWIDPAGQRVSPPPNVDSNGREMSIDGIHRSDLRLLGDDDERKVGLSSNSCYIQVNIFVEDGDKLGLKIRGGAEYGLGIYIAGVDPKSAADKAGLKCGDQIMDVNGLSFLNISHADAVKVLKTAKNMMVTMKDVGRLPFAKTTTDRTKWANSTLQRRNTTAGITRFERRPEDSKFRQGIAGSQLMYNGTGPSTKSLTEEQARQILNDHEFGTMAYYLEEYRKGFITVDEFVLALFSLFNTPAKVSLLTEIRGSILPKDIDRFDDLVLKKEIDAIKTRNMTATSQEDALSIRSYSSSMSSYSERSSSSRSSAKDSPLELSGILPMSSSSPRSPTQSVTNGEITKCLLIGDNPRRSFHLSEDEATDKSDAKKTSRKLNETAKDDTSKKDYSERHEITSGKEEISSVAPPKPKPYHTYTQEQTMKENVSRTLNIDKQDDDYVDIDGMDAVPSLKPKLSSHSLDPIRPQNEYVDIDIKEPSVAPPTMPKPYSSTTEAKITEKSTPSDPLQSNATPQIDIRVLSFENLETPKETQWLEGTSQHQSTEGLGKSTFNAVGKKSNIPPPKPAPYSPTREDREGLGKSTLNAVGKKSSIPPPKPAPYSPTREDHRDGMFLAMEATTSNRSGLERSTSWGDESAPCDSNSLYSVVQLFDDKSRTRKPKEFTSATINGAHVTQPELTSPGPIIPPTEDVNTSVLSIQHSNTKEFCRNDKENDNDSNLITDVETKTGHMVTTPDENQNVTEELHSRSSVRNMINAYNHMSDGDRLRSKSHNDTRSNRKSWDGVHNYAVSDESHTISSLENKRRLKSNSDSNLVNLPKDQQKDIQVKLRASQELLDLRQQSRESSTNNSPRHSIDAGSQHLTDPHTPASDPDHLFRSHHGVGYEVQIEHTAKGLGLSLEDESSANEPLKIKSVKEGPYAAHLSGKLRAGQEVCQINKAPVKGMTNAMTVLTLRQAYSDPDTKTLELVVKDP
ncbi:hypothetical protein QZH41_015764, partial [Actinostola sp. cb2023]